MFLSSGYFLTATGSAAFSDAILTSPPSDEVGIEGWNQREDSNGFVYSNIHKAGLKYTVLVKCLVKGDFLVIDFMSSNYPDKEPHSLQINVNDYNGGDGERSTDFADQFRNFDELVKKLHTEILSKLEDTTPSFAAPSVTPEGVFEDFGDGFNPRYPDLVNAPWLNGPNNAIWWNPKRVRTIPMRPSTPHPDVGILRDSDSDSDPDSIL
ncbi:hypothetical protein MKW98_012758 [Papaver atlanticum]|uniref:PI31 proteasome regulator N-terminal domain-containing protein n=1 Tax=Papaver atlanticum TaxID=357466 RepID=A0AAD4T4E1_9MAGN|nr:hypothetical protein MKW98_012758 [Papaver atlanticum]